MQTAHIMRIWFVVQLMRAVQIIQVMQLCKYANYANYANYATTQLCKSCNNMQHATQMLSLPSHIMQNTRRFALVAQFFSVDAKETSLSVILPGATRLPYLK